VVLVIIYVDGKPVPVSAYGQVVFESLLQSLHDFVCPCARSVITQRHYQEPLMLSDRRWNTFADSCTTLPHPPTTTWPLCQRFWARATECRSTVARSRVGDLSPDSSASSPVRWDCIPVRFDRDVVWWSKPADYPRRHGGRLRVRYPHRCKKVEKVTGTMAAATP